MVRAVGAGTGFETFIEITADGAITAFNGHVDLGTGIRTALGQIVAEELDVSFARVAVVLGDTARVPNQGATIASETIQVAAVPLRKAAAQARQFLIARAAERLELAVGGACRRRRPDPRRRQPQRQLRRIDRRRDHPARACGRGAAQAGRFVQHRRAVDPARRSRRQGHRRGGLCSRRARARHAAWPRGAAALRRRRRRRFCRHEPDRGRRGLGPRHSGAGRGGDESAISSASSPSARKTRSRPPRSSR